MAPRKETHVTRQYGPKNKQRRLGCKQYTSRVGSISHGQGFFAVKQDKTITVWKLHGKKVIAIDIGGANFDALSFKMLFYLSDNLIRST